MAEAALRSLHQTLVAHWSTFGHPQKTLVIEEETVRPGEQPCAEAVDDIAVEIEF